MSPWRVSATDWRWWWAFIAVALLAAGIAACGFGTYDDKGGAQPGQWWPWVCAEGGIPSADGGCLPVSGADASSVDGPVDAGSDGAF